MGYKYFICDVFTKERFTGNQLAVVPEASGLSSKQMQAIANEFNFSETVFIMPPENFKTRKLKIYTPTVEVPFAGHPNISTAFILAKAGYLGNIQPPVQLTFEEKAGEVDVEIKTDSDGAIYCEVAAPQPLSISNTINTNLIASVLTIDNSEIVTTTHEPVVASVGLPFIFVEISSSNSLSNAQIDISALRTLLAYESTSYIHIYTKDVEGFDLKARMFAPLDGVIEDPATGSASCALASLLGHINPVPQLDTKFLISQGTEIGRPSIIQARVIKRNGQVKNSFVGGNSVLISEGIISI